MPFSFRTSLGTSLFLIVALLILALQTCGFLHFETVVLALQNSLRGRLSLHFENGVPQEGVFVRLPISTNSSAASAPFDKAETFQILNPHLDRPNGYAEFLSQPYLAREARSVLAPASDQTGVQGLVSMREFPTCPDHHDGRQRGDDVRRIESTHVTPRIELLADGPTRSLKPRSFALSRSYCGPIRKGLSCRELACFLLWNGGPDRTRICDLYRVKVAL